MQLEIPLPTAAPARSAGADAIVLLSPAPAPAIALPAALLGVADALVICRSAAASVRIAALPVAAVDTTGVRDCFCGPRCVPRRWPAQQPGGDDGAVT